MPRIRLKNGAERLIIASLINDNCTLSLLLILAPKTDSEKYVISDLNKRIHII